MVPKPCSPKVLAPLPTHDQRLKSELVTELDEQLLRGVPLDVIETFLSHDWATSRWQKLLAMLVLFNSRAASLAAFAVCAVCMIPAMFRPSMAAWCLIPGYVVFVLLLLFWQPVRASLCGPKLVFLDRLCISQHDHHLKEQGILGLASFVDASKSLTVLWSPRYFSRLWCSFELAVFLRQEGSSSRVKQLRIMPTGLGFCFFTVWCGAGFSTLVYGLTKYLLPNLIGDPKDPPSWILFLETQLIFWVGLAFGMAFFLYAGDLMSSLRTLRSQLKSYDVQRCECYCCSNDHKDPCGSKIPCDRQLVFNTVREWYGKAEGESGHSWAEEFNELVKGHLSDVVQSSLSHTFAEVGLASRLTVPWIVLLAPLMLAPLANPLDEMQDTQQLAWYITVVLDWFKMVCVFLLNTGLIWRMMPLMQVLSQRLPRWVAALLCILTVQLLTGLAWLPYEVHLLRQGSRYSLAPSLTFALLPLSILAVYFPGSRCRPT